MLQLTMTIQGWPEDFLMRYTSKSNTDLHDHSMSHCMSDSSDMWENIQECEYNDVVHEPEYGLKALARRMEMHTYSTAFSGIDSPGTSFAQIRAATNAQLGTQGLFKDPEHIHAIDASHSKKKSTTFVCLLTSNY